jgi:hypothetical protein
VEDSVAGFLLGILLEVQYDGLIELKQLGLIKKTNGIGGCGGESYTGQYKTVGQGPVWYCMC